MGTEVLRPHDCLTDRIMVPHAAVFPRRRSFYNHHHHHHQYQYYTSQAPKPTSTTAPARSKHSPSRSDPKRKPSPSPSPPTVSRRSSSNDLKSLRNHHHHHHHHKHHGQVTILKRGDPSDLFLSSTERLGPSPAAVGKQIRIFPNANAKDDVVYAGSAFSVSPAPESLPLPTFSKKQQHEEEEVVSATRDLRRLLRLE